jgi:hypothetical protein
MSNSSSFLIANCFFTSYIPDEPSLCRRLFNSILIIFNNWPTNEPNYFYRLFKLV